jgi:dolichol-phosphate mannosyltransferase
MNEAVISHADAVPSPTGSVRQLSVIVPTFNERDNVGELIRRLDIALTGIVWEVIFVDDNSPDDTWALVREYAQADHRIRCIRRIGRRGLSGACVEGILASSAPYACVIDADLQHDETQLPKMLALLQSGQADLVVGSRYVSGGSSDSFSSRRQSISNTATLLARRLLKIEITDPMSGFFMIRSDSFEDLSPALSTQGFKILLDVVATAKGKLRIAEIPYTFGARLHGESKLDSLVVLDFIGLLLAKLSNDAISLRFVMFGSVGAFGLFVHLFALAIALHGFGMIFAAAQAVAAFVAMTSNFLLNNLLTYRDQRLHGTDLIRGLLKFYLVSSVGLIANVGVAFVVYDREPIWWLAGAAGSLMAVIWNYSMSSLLVWRKR